MSKIQASWKGWQSPALTLLQEDEDYRAEIAERYADGETLQALAEELGVSWSTLRTHLLEAGAEIRPRGRPPTP